MINLPNINDNSNCYNSLQNFIKVTNNLQFFKKIFKVQPRIKCSL